MPWRLRITDQARKDLDRLPERDRTAIESRLSDLADDPSRGDIRKLGGRTDQWRLRVGRWRAIIRFDNSAGMLHVVRVLPRDRAYRD